MSAAVQFATLVRMHADALEAQIRTMRAQADAVEVGAITERSTPRYATAKSNPLGSPRAFLDAHRRGHFATFKRRREIVALWTDVETWIESRKLARRERKAVDDADDERALLIGAGLQLPPANRRAGRR